MTKRLLTRLIEKNANVLEEVVRDYIGASSIGADCWRQIWYDFKGYKSKPFSPKQLRTFEIGKRLESLAVDLLVGAGLDIEVPSIKNNFLEFSDSEHCYFKGHCDAIILSHNAILEIKAVKDASFKIFVKEGFKSWNKKYFDQVQAYMGMSGLKKAYVFMINKDTSELHDELVLFDPDYYDQLRTKARMIFESDSPPPKINSSPLWYECKQCKFNEVCHE